MSSICFFGFAAGKRIRNMQSIQSLGRGVSRQLAGITGESAFSFNLML
jgi:hypothetical protein